MKPTPSKVLRGHWRSRGVLIGALCLAACQRPTQEQLRQEAQAAEASGDLHKAERCLSRAIKRDPLDDKAWKHLLRLLLDRNQFDELRATLGEVPQDLRGLREVRLARARLELSEGATPREAVDLYHQGELPPEATATLVHNAAQDALERTGHPGEPYFRSERFPRELKESVFDQIIAERRFEPLIDACALRSFRQLLAGRCRALLEKLKQDGFTEVPPEKLLALSDLPVHDIEYLARLDALLRLGRFAEARALSPSALLEDSDFRASWNQRLAVLALSQQDYLTTLLLSTSVAEGKGIEQVIRAHACLLRVVALSRLGRPEEARTQMRVCTELDGAMLLLPELEARPELVPYRSLLQGLRLTHSDAAPFVSAVQFDTP